MDDLARAEYPAMLSHLQPNQAAQVLNDRVKRIGKVNNEIADWLQERRRVEEQYVQGLRKLAQFRVPNAQSELGVFQTPWARILGAVERIAQTITIRRRPWYLLEMVSLFTVSRTGAKVSLRESNEAYDRFMDWVESRPVAPRPAQAGFQVVPR
ncbi:hypothetical protein NLG97_g802 [Lecanicillium saksenae]|uniref:Uncharacterized protein n=1 Tax=Lecanicillium saksenae TaxID=468837 RepID=A0ACC1R7A8_9HYPO|nr:hypothetical protein NLG97_g802 [Lecanicillium saksenae]